jgi:hypothetical protein
VSRKSIIVTVGLVTGSGPPSLSCPFLSCPALIYLSSCLEGEEVLFLGLQHGVELLDVVIGALLQVVLHWGERRGAESDHGEFEGDKEVDEA